MEFPLNSPDKFFSSLRRRLALPLPGEAAQNKMTSRVRISTADYLRQRPDHVHSAVILPLFLRDQKIFTALIRRPSYPGAHSGQLALPGGKREPSDTSLLETALRETREEVGIEISHQHILGALTSLYIPVSNFLVQPFIALLPEAPKWEMDKNEVDAIIETPVEIFSDQKFKDRKRITIGKSMFIEAPCYLVNGEILWGATAMIFSELEAILAGE